jgi:hypothetical protein
MTLYASGGKWQVQNLYFDKVINLFIIINRFQSFSYLAHLCEKQFILFEYKQINYEKKPIQMYFKNANKFTLSFIKPPFLLTSIPTEDSEAKEKLLIFR